MTIQQQSSVKVSTLEVDNYGGRGGNDDDDQLSPPAPTTHHHHHPRETLEGAQGTFFVFLAKANASGEKPTRSFQNSPNFYSLIDYKNHPPQPGSQINLYVWRQFAKNVVIDWWERPRTFWCLLLLNLTLTVIMFVYMGIMPENYPIEVSIVIIIASLWCISSFGIGVWGIKLYREHAKKVISEMKDLFKTEGYHVEFVSFYMRPYAKFTPTQEGRLVDDDDTGNGDEDDTGDIEMFCLADWEPLIGTWERQYVKDVRVLWKSGRIEFEEKQSFQFVKKQEQDYDDDDDDDGQNQDDVVLVSNSISHITGRGGKFNKEQTTFQSGKTKGNTLHRKTVRIYDNQFNQDVPIRHDSETKIVPLARCSYGRGASCYKWGDSAAAYVQNDTLVIVKLPNIDALSKSDLIISDIKFLTSEIRYTRTSRMTTSIITASSDNDISSSSGLELV